MLYEASGFLAAKAVSNWVSVVLSLSLMSVCSSSEFEDSIEDTLELSSSLFLRTTASSFLFFGLKLSVLLQTGFVGFFLPKSTSA